MRNRRPIFLLFVGSITVGIASFVFLLLLYLFSDQFPTYLLFVGPFTITASTYLIFAYLINVFLKDRLQLIYRSIRKGKFTKENETRFKLTDDVITNVEEATREWTEERNKEISKLKEQEEFRREFLGNLAH